MRKRLLVGLIIGAACLFGAFRLIPLHAEDGWLIDIQEPCAGQVIDGPKIPLTVAFKNVDTVPVVRFDVSLDGVRFYGAPFTKAIPAGSFKLADQCDVSRLKLTAGSHVLTVRLTDAQGRAAERTQLINYQPINLRPVERRAPRVRIVSPANGATISGKTDVRVESSDDTGIRLVRVFIDGKSRALSNKDVFIFTWDPIEESYSEGSHELSARVWDLFDNLGESDAVMVDVVKGGGWTPIETDPTPPLTSGLTTVAVLLPTENDTTDRLAFSNVIASALTSGATVLMPELVAGMPRSPLTAQPSLSATAWVPTLLQPQELLSLSTLPLAASAGRVQTAVSLPTPRTLIFVTAPTNSVAPVTASGTPVVPTPATPATNTVPAMSAPVTVQPSAVRQQPTGIAPIGSPVGGQVIGTVYMLTPSDSTKGASATVSVPGITSAALVDLKAPVVIAAVPLTARAAQLGVVSAPSQPVHETMVMLVPQMPSRNLPPVTGPSVAPGIRPVILAPGTAAQPVTKVAVPTVQGTQPVLRVPVATAQLPQLPATQGATTATKPTATSPLASLNNRYTVQSGDSLHKIARKYGTTTATLQKLNPTIAPEKLAVGTTIAVPRRGAQLTLDNTTLNGPAPYVAGQGYAMIPMRWVVEAKGGVIVWLPKTQQAQAWVGNTFFGVTIGKKNARLDSSVYMLPVPAAARDERTMVPLRFMADGLKMQMTYDPASNTYSLISPAE